MVGFGIGWWSGGVQLFVADIVFAQLNRQKSTAKLAGNVFRVRNALTLMLFMVFPTLVVDQHDDVVWC